MSEETHYGDLIKIIPSTSVAAKLYASLIEEKLKIIKSAFYQFELIPMESQIEVGENLQNHEFDVNLLPVEMLIEIFSYLKYNERLKAALVCKRWFKIARDHQYDLPLKKLVRSDEINEFINIFKEGSMSLPVQCIKFKIWRLMNRQIPYDQINDIVKQYGHVKIVAKVYVHSAEDFLQLIENLPEMFKNFIWKLYSTDNFQKHWLDICNAVQSKKIEVVIHGEFFYDNPLNKEILSTLIKTPVKNVCIEKLFVHPMILKGFEQKKLVELLKTLKFAGLIASEPEDFIFFNQFLSPSVTHFTLRTVYWNVYNTRNFLELLPNLTNVQQIKIDIMNSSIPLSFTSRILNFPKLKKFEFTTFGSVLLEYESFKRLIESFPNLQEITLITYGYSEEQAIMLIENICLFCPFLKKLLFQDNSHNARGNSQSHYFRALKKLQHLESLIMTGCEFQTNVLNGLQINALKELNVSFTSMDPEDARMLITAFPNLEKLTLTRPIFTDIKEMDTNTVKVLSQLQNLKYIKITYCPDGSTEAFTNILKENNPDLKVDTDKRM